MMPVNLLQWLTPWEPSALVVIAIGAAAIVFLRGSQQAPTSHMQHMCFWSGLMLFYAVSHTMFDYYSEHAFFMHRIQSAALHHEASFLIALSRPGSALKAGLPPAWKNKAVALLQSAFVQKTAAIANNPFMAVSLFTGVIFFWLLPPVHFIAMLDWRLYRLMNWSMALNGLMFWNLALNNYALAPAHLSASRRILLMFAVIPPQIIMGLLLFAAPHELYPVYTLCGRVFPLSALADQQMGGLILWVPAAMMSVIGIIIVIKREWMIPSLLSHRTRS